MALAPSGVGRGQPRSWSFAFSLLPLSSSSLGQAFELRYAHAVLFDNSTYGSGGLH